MGVFSLEFLGLLKSRICFEREFYIFAAGHCIYKVFLLYFFCHPGSFLNENYWFLMVKLLFFTESVGFFGFKHFVRQCCGRFFIGIYRLF